MNIVAGLEFFLLLIIFGLINFSIMLMRYTNDLKRKRISQLKKIASLYPKGTYIST